MATYIYLATVMGLFVVADNGGDWKVVRHTMADQPLTSVVASEGVILAGAENGIWRSSDNGETWTAAGDDLTIRHVRALDASKGTGTLYAGTEPAGIFLSKDKGRSWRIRPEVVELRDANGWMLPYSPAAGCVRGFAVADSPGASVRVYAAAEVGGVLVSNDNGNSWQLVQGSDGKPDWDRKFDTMIHPDVHSIMVHPSSPDRVTAATGGGLYRSADGGESWENLYQCYIRAVWVDPSDADRIIAGPADGVSRNGRVEVSVDGGKTWQLASGGMQTPWQRHMVERFVQIEEKIFAVVSNGELWSTRLENEIRWEQTLPEIKGIRALAAGN